MEFFDGFHIFQDRHTQGRKSLLECKASRNILPVETVQRCGIESETSNFHPLMGSDQRFHPLMESDLHGQSKLAIVDGELHLISPNLYVIGGEVQITYAKEQWNNDWDHDPIFQIYRHYSFFEFCVGKSVFDRVHFFSLDIMQKLFYGRNLVKLQKTTTSVIVCIPIMFDCIQLGNVFSRSSLSGLDVKCSIRHHRKLSFSAKAKLILRTVKCSEFGLGSAFQERNNGGERIMIQHQFTGFGSLSLTRNGRHKIRLNFNMMCPNLFIAFRTLDGRLICDPHLLNTICLQLNGLDAISVKDPSKIYGTSPQFIRPIHQRNDFDTGRRPLFPQEVWMHVFSELNYHDARALAMTCKYLWNFSKQPTVWPIITREYTPCPGWFCIPFFDQPIITDYYYSVRHSLDFSRIDNATLLIEFKNQTEYLESIVFTTSFNIFRSQDGLMGLGFSM